MPLAMLDGKRNPDNPVSTLWPRQPEPSTVQRRLWKRFIASSYLCYIPYWKTSPTPPRRPIITRPQEGPPPHPPPSLKSLIKQLPKSQRRLLVSLQQVATDDALWNAFQSRQRINIASDGGLTNKDGTFGWVLATKTETLLQCSGPVFSRAPAIPRPSMP